MPIDQDLLKKATDNPRGVRFDEAVKLAVQMGWVEVGGKGSHRVFRHPQAPLIRDKFPRPLNLQEGDNGKAKGYQVEQLLAMAKELGIIPTEESED